MCQIYPHRALKIALNFSERGKRPQNASKCPKPPRNGYHDLERFIVQILILPPVRARELLFPSSRSLLMSFTAGANDAPLGPPTIASNLPLFFACAHPQPQIPWRDFGMLPPNRILGTFFAPPLLPSPGY